MLTLSSVITMEQAQAVAMKVESYLFNEKVRKGRKTVSHIKSDEVMDPTLSKIVNLSLTKPDTVNEAAGSQEGKVPQNSSNAAAPDYPKKKWSPRCMGCGELGHFFVNCERSKQLLGRFKSKKSTKPKVDSTKDNKEQDTTSKSGRGTCLLYTSPSPRDS